MADTEELLRQWSSIAPVEDDQWASLRPGPSVVAVAARLSTVPADFLAEQASIPALAGDLLGTHTLPRLAALAARDSLRFNQALAASFAEHRHRDELRRRLDEARAREAAARYSRE